jgi:hypothetical protein
MVTLRLPDGLKKSCPQPRHDESLLHNLLSRALSFSVRCGHSAQKHPGFFGVTSGIECGILVMNNDDKDKFC